jgi:hypothetical protein
MHGNYWMTLWYAFFYLKIYKPIVHDRIGSDLTSGFDVIQMAIPPWLHLQSCSSLQIISETSNSCANSSLLHPAKELDSQKDKQPID